MSTSGLTKVATAVVMAVGGISVLQGTMTVGSLLVVLSYFAALYSPIEAAGLPGRRICVGRSRCPPCV